MLRCGVGIRGLGDEMVTSVVQSLDSAGLMLQWGVGVRGLGGEEVTSVVHPCRDRA